MVLDLIVNIIIFITLYLALFWMLVLFNFETKGPRIKKYPSLTIFIPAYNEGKNIAKTIDSVKNADYPGILEILVIDDKSSDDTYEQAKKFKEVKVIKKKKNEGKPKALNQALQMCKTDLFAVLDADSTIARNALKNGVRYFYQNDAVGAVISKMRPENTDKNLVERIQVIEYMFVGLIRALSASLRLLHITPGVLSIYKTKALREIGGFDVKNVTEDFEAAVRLRKNNYLINYAHNSLTKTVTPSDFKTFLKQRVRWARGFIQTHVSHRDIFFNKKQGLFGMYEFPMNLVSPLVFFIAVFVLMINIVDFIYQSLYTLIVTPGVIDWLDFPGFRTMILSLDIGILLPIFMSLFLILTFIMLVFKFYDYKFFEKHKFKNIVTLFFYLMVYNYIYLYVWLKGLYKEIIREKYQWETKS